MERCGHDTVGRVEGLFDTIAVVNIDINVQDTLMETQQLKDRQNNVVDVAES